MTASSPASGYVPPHQAPPASLEAEQAVLGAVLVNNAAWHAIGPVLESSHFSEDVHRRIWEVASTLIREGRVASPITLRPYLGEHAVSEGMTMPRYLASLAADAVTVVNAPDYARLIVDLAVRRDLMSAGEEIIAEALDPPAALPAARLIERGSASLYELGERFAALTANTRLSAAAVADAVLDKVDRIRAGEEVGRGATTAIPSIDDDTGGMRPGDLWIVAGRVAMGKSVLAVSLAKAAARSGVGTLLFPFEIGPLQAMARVLANVAYKPGLGLGYGQILKGEMDDDGRRRLDAARDLVAPWPLVLDSADGATLAQISARVRAERDRMARAGVKLGVVVLDYLNFIRASDRYGGQRHNEIGEISIGLKRLAMSLGVCVVLLAQVNRQTEGRVDKRPQLADLKDSGSLESDADVVAFVYREIYYIERSPEYLRNQDDAVVQANEVRDVIEVIVAKNRTGPARNHVLWCDPASSIVAAQARSGLG